MADFDAVKLHKPALYRLAWKPAEGDELTPYYCDGCPFFKEIKWNPYDELSRDAGTCSLLGKDVDSRDAPCRLPDWQNQAQKEAVESLKAAQYLDKRARSLQNEIAKAVADAAIAGDESIKLSTIKEQLELNPGLSEALSRVLEEVSKNGY